MLRIAINGFGRIGRTFLRTVYADAALKKKFNVIAINTGSYSDYVAHAFVHDTIMKKFPGTVEQKGDLLIIDGHPIKLYAHEDPVQLPWGELGIEWVVEATGMFTSRAKAQLHQEAGAQKVLITAPAQNEDISIIPGINEELYDAQKHTIISLGSCTTNAFIPLIKIIEDSFGIERGFMTTVHAYTNTQALLDSIDKTDPRRSRAAAVNIVPTTTGAMDMLDKIIPGMSRRMYGGALRVPVADVSLIDLSCITQKEVSVSTLHAAVQHAIRGRMRRIVDMTMEPLVSSDFCGNPHSVIIDGMLSVAHHRSLKVFGWYDNEWGYSMRLRDFLIYIQK